MKTKPCIGYAPVVDGEIDGYVFYYKRRNALVCAGAFYNGKKFKIIKVEIRPVKKKSKPKKKGN